MRVQEKTTLAADTHGAARSGPAPAPPPQWGGARASLFIPETVSAWHVARISSIRDSGVKIKPRTYYPTSSIFNFNSKNCGMSHTGDQVLGLYLLATWLRSNYWRALSFSFLTCQMGWIMPSTVCEWGSGKRMNIMCPRQRSLQWRDSIQTGPVLLPRGPSILVAAPPLLDLFSPGLGALWKALCFSSVSTPHGTQSSTDAYKPMGGQLHTVSQGRYGKMVCRKGIPTSVCQR